MRIFQKISLLKLILYIILILCSVAILYYIIPEKRLPSDAKIDRILVEKSKRQMHVFSKGNQLKTYIISLGFRPIGKKQFKGDGKTPEGKYRLITKNSHSIAYKSFGISYPNANDRRYAATKGRSAGGDIMIHGIMNGFGSVGNFHRFIDWTGGCIAVTNDEMDELFKHVDVGCEILIEK